MRRRSSVRRQGPGGQLRPGAYLVQVTGRADAIDAAELAHEVDQLLAAL
jgi:hypothetical protein